MSSLVSLLLHTAPNSPCYTPQKVRCTCPPAPQVNVIVPSEKEEEDPLEAAIPEQFVTRYRAGRWVTEAVSHSAA